MTKNTVLCLAAVLSLVACEEEAPTSPTTPPPEQPQPVPGSDEPPPAPQSDTPVDEQMQIHFQEATAARDAVIRGDADAARAALRELAELDPTASYPPTWDEQVTAFRAVVSEAAAGEDLAALAIGVGRVANACGSCHTSVGGQVSLTESPPPSGDDTASHMLRHQWAADRIFEGLMVPADERFTAGAGALVDAPLGAESIADDRTVPQEVTDLANRVHELGRNATLANEATVRAQLYGELIVTCADCHRQLEARQ